MTQDGDALAESGTQSTSFSLPHASSLQEFSSRRGKKGQHLLLHFLTIVREKFRVYFQQQIAWPAKIKSIQPNNCCWVLATQSYTCVYKYIYINTYIYIHSEQAFFWPRNQTPVSSCHASLASLKCILCLTAPRTSSVHVLWEHKNQNMGSEDNWKCVSKAYYEPKWYSKSRNRLHERSNQPQHGT